MSKLVSKCCHSCGDKKQDVLDENNPTIAYCASCAIKLRNMKKKLYRAVPPKKRASINNQINYA
jgi:hypothetical protein